MTMFERIDKRPTGPIDMLVEWGVLLGMEAAIRLSMRGAKAKEKPAKP